jgi:hypothetical protein
MKTHKLLNTNSIPRLLVVPVIFSLAFAACSNVGGMAEPHATVNLQSAAVGMRQTGDNVTIDPSTSAPRVLLTRIGR